MSNDITMRRGNLGAAGPDGGMHLLANKPGDKR